MTLGGPNWVPNMEPVIVEQQKNEPPQILATIMEAVLYGAAVAAMVTVLAVLYGLWYFRPVGVWGVLVAGIAIAFLLGFAWHVHIRVQLDQWDRKGYRQAHEALAVKLNNDIAMLQKRCDKYYGDWQTEKATAHSLQNRLDKLQNPSFQPAREEVSHAELELAQACRKVLEQAYYSMPYSRKAMVPAHMRDPMWEAVMTALSNASMATKANYRNAPYVIVRISDVEVAYSQVEPYLQRQLVHMGQAPIPSHSRGSDNGGSDDPAGQGSEEAE